MVEAAPQARPKTTPMARIVVEVCLLVPFTFGHCLDHLGWWWGLVGQCFCNVCFLNALPVPMLRQVSQNSCFTCMGAHFRSNMAPDPEMLPETSSGRLQGEF